MSGLGFSPVIVGMFLLCSSHALGTVVAPQKSQGRLEKEKCFLGYKNKDWKREGTTAMQFLKYLMVKSSTSEHCIFTCLFLLLLWIML